MLMRSVSGLRGVVGKDLRPDVVAKHAAAFGQVMGGKRIVVATDTRPTGPMIKEAAISGLQSVGCDVIDIGITPTPTVPLAVTRFRAAAGLAITASHNPIQWNALKFLGSSREVLSPQTLKRVYRLADSGSIAFRPWDRIGGRRQSANVQDLHIRRVLALKAVDQQRISRAAPVVAFDAGAGAAYEYGPALLWRLGCRVHAIHCKLASRFPRGPEPVPQNLDDLTAAVHRKKADIGFAVDPDGDRLAIVDESGRPLGEERTLVLATYWVLSKMSGPVVVNLSTSRAVLDVAAAFGQKGYTSKVGEVNVAVLMKAKRAVIGGEGNGGVIMPALHPGRDALLGMALILSLLANTRASISEIDAGLPRYYAAKRTAPRPNDLPRRLKRFSRHYIKERQDERDGIKVIFDDGSVHVRPSNTEPIVRMSAEGKTRRRARALLAEVRDVMEL